eukprot:6198149-Pleurochrysis_carterae.AAC.1
MFVNVGPASSNAAETLNSLAFAQRAKSVSLGKATKNKTAAAANANAQTSAPSRTQADAHTHTHAPPRPGSAATTMAAAGRLGEGGAMRASPGPKKKAAARR